METQGRYDVYRLLTSITHGELGPLVQAYTAQLERDPAFLVPLAAWLQDNHKIRDMVNAAVASLVFFSHPNPQLQDWVRTSGLGILNRLSIRDVHKVVAYGLTRGTLPRSVKTEIRNYLHKLEANESWDRIAIGQHKSLSWLYARTYTPMGDMAQACLVDKTPPHGTAFWAVQNAANIENIYERARFLLDHGVPYLTLTTFLSPKDPVALLALVEAMSPQQLANNLAMLKRSGAEDNPQVAKYIREKLSQGARKGTLNVGRLGTTAKVVDSAVAEEAVEAAIGKYAIRRDTGMFIDKSGSLTAAIHLMTHIGPYVAAAAGRGGAKVEYVAFNDRAQTVLPGTTLADFQALFARHTPGGYTAFGSPFSRLTRPVEQVVFLTDQQETRRPFFLEGYREYAQRFNTNPDVVVIHLRGADDDIVRVCEEEGIKCDVYNFTGDYNQITPILQLLSGKSFYDIIDDILEMAIPKRLTRA